MIALAIAAFVTITVIATGLTLVDSWLRARHALAAIRRERALLAAARAIEVHSPRLHYREARLRRSAQRLSRASLLVGPRPVRALRMRGAA